MLRYSKDFIRQLNQYLQFWKSSMKIAFWWNFCYLSLSRVSDNLHLPCSHSQPLQLLPSFLKTSRWFQCDKLTASGPRHCSGLLHWNNLAYCLFAVAAPKPSAVFDSKNAANKHHSSHQLQLMALLQPQRSTPPSILTMKRAAP